VRPRQKDPDFLEPLDRLAALTSLSRRHAHRACAVLAPRPPLRRADTAVTTTLQPPGGSGRPIKISLIIGGTGVRAAPALRAQDP